jgi:hypothetical protein
VREHFAGGKPGVVLGGGDVIEGEVQRLDNDKLAVSSVIMGLQELEWPQARLVMLRPVTPAGDWRVTRRDGSVYCGKAISATEGAVKVTTGSLGEVSVNADDLAAISHGK